MDTEILCRTLTTFQQTKWTFQFCLHNPLMLLELFAFFPDMELRKKKHSKSVTTELV